MAGRLSISKKISMTWMAFFPGVFALAQSSGSLPSRWNTLLDQYCVTCHNGQTKSEGITFADADLHQVPRNAEFWERVIRKVRAGVMPPAGMPRPDRPGLDGFAAWLETTIDRANKQPDPGPALLRRLNRAEYAAAVRDLLALEIDASSLLPADDSQHGFDNSADALKVSPALLDAYLAASRKIARLAIGDPAALASFTLYRARADLGQDQHIDGLPLGTRGGMAIRHLFPLDGEYDFKTKLAVNTSAKVRGLDFENEFVLVIDGTRVHEAKLGGPADEDAAAINPTDSERDIVSRLAVRLPVKAGPHTVGITFVKKSSALPDGVMQPFARSNFDTQEQRGVPFIESLGIGGPIHAGSSGDTPSRRNIFVCRPENTAEEVPCARRILSSLMRAAYRRPVTDSDLETPLGFFQAGRNSATGQDPFEAGIEAAVRFVLTSPEFLFRMEPDPPAAKPGSVHPLTRVQLASRLSFFLWSSIPDEELLEAAVSGDLNKPPILEEQVRRMLKDPRSRALVSNFASQWLQLRNLSTAARDLPTFPDFDDNLRQGFRRETELFFESVLREDRSVLDLLQADYTFLDERLARHYGVSGVEGSYFRRVTLPGEARRGLLGQGSILTVTSYATRTSPVLRGKWILENILGVPVPPPPPGVPALEENHAGTPPRSVRERLEEHRKNPACAGCHNLMDPLGFSLENFDATGSWRHRTESRAPVDASGSLVDGTRVDGPVSLRAALLSRPKLFAGNVTEKLLTYALGRGVEWYDMPSVRAIVRRSAPGDYRFSSIVLGIVNSIPFQNKKTDSALTDSGPPIKEGY
jgi:mono/diheme cytochrome c family protein